MTKLDEMRAAVDSDARYAQVNADLDEMIHHWRAVLAKHPGLQQDPAGTFATVAGSLLAESELGRSYAAHVSAIGALAIQRLVAAAESPDSRDVLGGN